MDIFIDTSIIFHDPYWKNNYNAVILDRAQKGKINIFISSVVMMELHKNYLKNVDEQLKKIRNAEREISEKYSLKALKTTTLDLQSLEDDFDVFYKGHIDKGTFKIIEPENNLLPEIINRAVWRKKPFTESKTELKDTIIWLSYAKFVESKKMENPFFLTSNINDFCNLSNKEEIFLTAHSDLVEDTERFKIVKTSKDFVKEIIEKNESDNKNNFRKNVQELNIDDVVIFSVLKSNYSEQIESKVQRSFEGRDFTKFFNGEFTCNGYFSPGISSWINCQDLEIDILEDSCIVTGIVNLDCEIEAYDYNSGRDEGEDKFTYSGSSECCAQAYFSLVIDIDLDYRNLEVEQIRYRKYDSPFLKLINK